MKVFSSAQHAAPIRNAVVTVGSFDGLHHGHRALLEEVKRKAREDEGESVVVTFWPHPRQVLAGGGDIRLLNTLKEKRFLLEDIGIDNMVALPFTPELSAMTSAEFVRSILVGKIGMKRFVVGYNHRFGSDGGDFDSLDEMQRELGFTAERIPRLDVHHQKVSSTIIRGLIASGDMEKAAQFLGGGYMLIADIVDGEAFIEDKAKLLPPAGEYKIKVELPNRVLDSILSISSAGSVTISEYGYGRVKEALIRFV